jgi:hypothetical protein
MFAREPSMRVAIVVLLFAAAFVIGAKPAAALPSALAEAKLSGQPATSTVDEVRLRSSKEGRKYVRTTKRRYDWTYYPYWRPYRYYYWQHYYPYGGPLF